ncbi:alpha/beta hydrolase [Goodfellowiella coeruleoviolacea]|uniref:Acetyl esterase/lipase n=1 Tax=Goodfellowiella coeruleoviolacea TaxID=334858 RepID=A0AAE3GF88_9PSEU|nr:alpha/beta hydrolase [Goodfellowiella coeruleoviolacea]MCP2167162.1 Acetyl esterase/lipase [Goodfellowiella coeruleoviolacea]
MSQARPPLRELIAAPHPETAPLPPAAPAAPGVRLLRGVPYADLPGTRPPELDLWLPDTPADGGGLPLLLLVHGGAWRRGRRDDLGPRLRDWAPAPFAQLASAGFAVASVDYRLSGEARFPAQLDDLRAALHWLTARSAELGIDPARTVVWGESAGGHLAALLALTHTDPAPVAAVLWYAPSDLATARPGYDPADPATPEALLLGAAPATVPDTARAASPLARVHPAAPPVLLVHGTDDSLVSCAHSQVLAEHLRAVGAEAELWLVPGADHAWHGLPDARVREIVTRSLDFARRAVAGG